MEFGSTLCSNEHHMNEARKKNSGLYKIWTHDLHKTGAVLYQLCNIQDINHAYWKTGPAWLNGG